MPCAPWSPIHKGTAYARFVGFPFPVSAKTGTAESGATDPHAWFAGYSLAGLPDKPDIAVAVIVNNQGEGATWAAPIMRRVMEIYFNRKTSDGLPVGIGLRRASTDPHPEPVMIRPGTYAKTNHKDSLLMSTSMQKGI